MARLIFQPGSTWRKLGYALYSDSSAYREILDQNPQWTVIENPPIGTALRNKPNTMGSVGGGLALSQQSPIVPRPSGDDTSIYYPFETKDDYFESLNKYTANALKKVEQLNGWSANSVASDTGIV